MKKIFYVASLLLFSISSSIFSQTVNGKPLSEIDAIYITVEIEWYNLSKCRAIIDYGQERVLSNRKSFRLKKDEEDMLFNSAMHIINYISQFGYEVINVIRHSNQSLENDEYLLKKVKK